MTSQMPIVSVPVLGKGIYKKQKDVLAHLGPSKYISEKHMEVLRNVSEELKLDADRQCRETDSSTTMEGLYIKIEENGEVVGRLKYVRASFSQCLDVSATHWLERPIIPNQLACSIDELFLF